jgi:integrase
VKLLADWIKSLVDKGSTPKHVKIAAGRARRIVAIVAGADPQDIELRPQSAPKVGDKVEAALVKATGSVRLRDLTDESVQAVLSTLRANGRSLETLNHYRASIKSFAKWCYDTHRTRDNFLRGVTGFNAKEDRRHDRRTVSLEELRRLIDAADTGPVIMKMSGRARALCYRLAVATGLRWSEIERIKPESFDWRAPSVTVAACYTKNRQPATMTIPNELVSDLAAYVATIASGEPIFSLPVGQGALMLRQDLAAAGIPYRDAGGLVFDFHALRCETATLLDAARVSGGVVQRRMRHSTRELTERYTRPRAADIDAAVERLPSLRPDDTRSERVIMTGTDPAPIATDLTTAADSDSPNSNGGNVLTMTNQLCAHPLHAPQLARHARDGTCYQAVPWK